MNGAAADAMYALDMNRAAADAMYALDMNRAVARVGEVSKDQVHMFIAIHNECMVNECMVNQ
jgi:hypothetical protein